MALTSLQPFVQHIALKNDQRHELKLWGTVTETQWLLKAFDPTCLPQQYCSQRTDANCTGGSQDQADFSSLRASCLAPTSGAFILHCARTSKVKLRFPRHAYVFTGVSGGKWEFHQIGGDVQCAPTYVFRGM